jgi:8-oxo-dGTP diphosphatase
MAEGGGAGAADGGPETRVTIIVDGANVVGSRPDGWWRDRAGAAVRLHDNLAKLAERGEQGIPAAELSASEPAATGDRGPAHDPGAGQAGAAGLILVTVLLVLEGAARRAVPRIAERARAASGDANGDGRADGRGEVEVVSAPGSGDDEIVRQAQHLAGHCIVVTADRELRRRCVAAGARVAGPSWLYGLL